MSQSDQFVIQQLAAMDERLEVLEAKLDRLERLEQRVNDLDARTDLLQFVDSKPIADQIDLGPTIMSRFDLMFMRDDTPDADRDAEIIEGMIANRQQAIEYTHHGNDEAGEDIAPKVRTLQLYSLH